MKKLLILLVLLTACSGGAVTEPAPVIRPQSGQELCGQACQHMVDLGCPEGSYVPATPDLLACQDGGCPELVNCPDGGAPLCVTCVWLCRYQLDNGVNWNTACLVEIKSCREIESVCNR